MTQRLYAHINKRKKRLEILKKIKYMFHKVDVNEFMFAKLLEE
jgi:hypothetical protein